MTTCPLDVAKQGKIYQGWKASCCIHQVVVAQIEKFKNSGDAELAVLSKSDIYNNHAKILGPN